MTEKSIYESARVFRELFDNMSSGVAVYEAYNDGEDFIIKDINNAGEKISKVKRKNILGKLITDIFPGVKKFGLFNVFQKVWKTGSSERYPVSMYKDERISQYVENYVYKLPSGYIVAIYDDVSELRRANEDLNYLNLELERNVEERTQKLRESEVRFKAGQKMARFGDWEFNIANGDMIWSEEVYRIYDFDPSTQLTYEILRNRIHPDDREWHDKNTQSWIETGEGEIYEYRIILSDGSIRYIYGLCEVSLGESGKPTKLLGTLQDITESKIAEQKLKDSEEKYRNFFQQYKMLVETITDSVYVLDKDWNYILVNEAAAKLVQLTANELLNNNLIELFPSIEETNFFKTYKSVMETKKMQRIRNEFTHPDGRYGVYEVSVYPITEGILCIARDITEEKEIERKLKKSEVKYRNLSNQYEMLLETITDSIFALNSDWEYILVNKSAEDINNIPRDKILGKKMQDLFPGIEDTPFFKIYESVMNTRNEERITESFTHPDGETRFYNLSVYPIHQGILCISRDVTEEKEIQQELEESEKKYRIAYDQTNLYKDIFAHDINNILQNIQASAELSSLYLNNPEKLHTIKELYEIVKEQISRGVKLIGNVRKITHIEETEIPLKKIELNNVLSKAIEFLKNSYQSRNINIQVNSSAKKIYGKGNDFILDIFENLLINSVHHNDQPIIEIEVSISRDQGEDKKFIRMEFKDNGLGISDYRKKSIFLRGTAQNQKTKGMGLGLSLVKKIIDSYEGSIWVEDRINGDYKLGSNFILLIPEAI